MSTKITRINEIAISQPKAIFTSIYQAINYELLMECFEELDGNKATGIDKITKDMYHFNLENNLNSIVDKLKRNGYRPSPARQIEIPKANGKMRKLAIANFEDKIVQLAIKKIIEAIWEPKFSDNMYGFRPNKNCHQALSKINNDIQYRNTNYILDADIKGYFDNINHDKLIKCLEMHVKDKRLLRLIKRFLTVGVMKDTTYIKGEIGTPQGSILSPVLANIYMYYMLIVWTEKIKHNMKGFVSLTNYADDFIICFQHKLDANKYLHLLKERLSQCSMELSEEKTRLIEFGKFANENAKKRGMSKAATFKFLGFTHYCSQSNDGRFRVKRKTAKDKFNKSVNNYSLWIKENRHKKLPEIMDTTSRKLTGHYNYYGITDNYNSIRNYYFEVKRILLKWLNRRSQKKSYDSEAFNDMLKIFNLPVPKIKVNIYAKTQINTML